MNKFDNISALKKILLRKKMLLLIKTLLKKIKLILFSIESVNYQITLLKINNNFNTNR